MSSGTPPARASIKERRAEKKKAFKRSDSEQHVHWDIDVPTPESGETKERGSGLTPTALRRSPRVASDAMKDTHSILKSAIAKSPKKVFTRRKAGQDSAGRLPGQDALIIDLDRLKQFFGVSQRQACSQLGIGLSTMKRLCRKFGIKRWPGKRGDNEPGSDSTPPQSSAQPDPPTAFFDFALPTPTALEEANLPSTRAEASRKIPPLNLPPSGLPPMLPTGKTPPGILPPPMWGMTGRTPPCMIPIPNLWPTGKTPPAILQPMWGTGKTPPGIGPAMWGRTPRGGNTPKNLVLDKDLVGAIASDSQNPFESSPEFVTPRNAAQWNTPQNASRGSRRNSLNSLLLGTGTPRNASASTAP